MNKEGLQLKEEVFLWKKFNKVQNGTTLISFAAIAKADISIKECIVVPIAFQAEMEEYNIFHNNSFELVFNENQEVLAIAAEENNIISYLSEKTNNYEYEIVNKIEYYLKNSGDLSSSLKIISWVANYSLLLITAGIIGVLLIMLDSRKKDMSISLVTGAARWMLATELMTELFMVCFSGALAAIMTSAFITPMLSSSQYRAVVTSQSIFLVTGICLFIAVFTSILSISQVKLDNPMKTLREV